MNHPFVLLYLFVVDCICAVAIWGGGAERIYKKCKHSRLFWLWLYPLRIPKTERNCVGIIQWVSFAGMVIATLGFFYVIFFMSAGNEPERFYFG